MLSVALYVVLQAWAAYAWVGRWRIGALTPLTALVALIIISSVGQLLHPELFGPSIGLLDNLIAVVTLFSPAGFIYLVIAGIAHRARGPQPERSQMLPGVGAKIVREHDTITIQKIEDEMIALIGVLALPPTDQELADGWSSESKMGIQKYLRHLLQEIKRTEDLPQSHLGRAMDDWGVRRGDLVEKIARVSSQLH